MDMNLIKYPKGSIWWLNADCLPDGDHISKKNRPVVVVSGNERGSSEVVEVCTITSVDKMHVCEGINVPFRNGYGTLNYIQTNQHFTVNTSYLNNYQGQLSGSVMQRLNTALRFAQDLGDMDELVSTVNELEKKLSSMNTMSCDKRAIKAGMAYLHTILNELNTYVQTADKKFAEILESNSSNVESDVPTSTRTYIKFTDDSMLEYLVDMDNVKSGQISESDFLNKWGIQNMTRARKKVRYINNKLSKKEEEQVK